MSNQFFLLKRRIKQIVYLMMSLVLLGGLPFPAYALAATTSTAISNNSSCPLATGTTKPTGASAVTYIYNPKTCLWSNAYYTWNPVNGVYTPLTPLTYTYNQSTGLWDSTQWVYDPVTNKYEQQPFSVSQVPTGAKTIGGPALTSSSSNTLNNQNSASNQNNSSSSSSSSASNGSNNVTTANTNNINLNNNNNANVNNTQNQTTNSGNSSVFGNTSAGNATSGNATSLATVVNSIASNSPLANATQFTANIDGNVNGNLTFNPTQLFQPANSSILNSNQNNVTINQANNSSITNNINLATNTGNATVADNNNAGSATSGNANSVANVVNMINSMISSRKSFIGVINILGDLNGNILVPQQFLSGLIASNAPRSTYAVNNNTLNKDSFTSNQNQTINNNISTSAASGSAIVNKNTTAGNATSGNASTNVTIFNLAGDNVSTSNSMLVFVNVLGTWVGMILNAPAGTTSALLGGGTQSTGSINNNQVNNVKVANTSNQTINNNIGLKSKSGNALVSENTNAGNATSGNATASANIANLENDNLNMSNWFGILFINVFGKWIGSLGLYNPLALSTNQSSNTTTGANTKIATNVHNLPAFSVTNANDSIAFSKIKLPILSGSSSLSGGIGSNVTNSSNNSVNNTKKPNSSKAPKYSLASIKKPINKTGNNYKLKALPKNSSTTEIFAIGAVGIGMALFGVDYIIRHKALSTTNR